MPRWLRLYLLNTLHSARPPKEWLSPPCSPALPLTEAGPHECLLRRAVAEGQKRMESVTSHALGALSRRQPQRSSLWPQNSPEVGLLHCLWMEKLRHKGPSYLPMEGSGSCFKPLLPQLKLQGPRGPADYNLGLCMSWTPVRMALQ